MHDAFDREQMKRRELQASETVCRPAIASIRRRVLPDLRQTLFERFELQLKLRTTPYRFRCHCNGGCQRRCACRAHRRVLHAQKILRLRGPRH
jgi:hypothetical protein